MNVFTFSLPEGCDLKLVSYGASASVNATYKGREFMHLATTILGEKISVRRKVRGVSFVVNSPDPVNHYDLTYVIRRKVAEEESGLGQLRENLKHLEGMPINPATMHMIQEQARNSFDQTRERMRRMAENIRPVEMAYTEHLFRPSREALHNQSYDHLLQDIPAINPAISVRIDENLGHNEIAFFQPATSVITRVVVNIGGNQYHVNENGLVDMRGGGEVRVTQNGDILNIHGIV